MAGKRRKKIREPEITGLKYFKKLLPLLERLHDDGCARDKAGNRKLHFDQYCTLILLYLFNPVVTSLRGLQQASELKKVQKKLGCKRSALGSLSEAAAVFDPERLKEIIDELGEQLEPLGRYPGLQDVQGLLMIVDGTLLAALPARTNCLRTSGSCRCNLPIHERCAGRTEGDRHGGLSYFCRRPMLRIRSRA